MAIYSPQEKQAEATGQPARAAKVRGIRREYRARLRTEYSGVTFPTYAAILARATAFQRTNLSFAENGLALYLYGRKKARQMITQPLPTVVAYDPETDSGWPF